jgi:hypothetical protein
MNKSKKREKDLKKEGRLRASKKERKKEKKE